jgi:hypothetical protein
MRVLLQTNFLTKLRVGEEFLGGRKFHEGYISGELRMQLSNA